MRHPSTTTACLPLQPMSTAPTHVLPRCLCRTVWLPPASLLVDLSAGVYEAGTVFLYKTNLSSAAIVEDRYWNTKTHSKQQHYGRNGLTWLSCLLSV